MRWGSPRQRASAIVDGAMIILFLIVLALIWT